MRAKPEFNWRGHKLLWDKLAKDGSLSKEEALNKLHAQGLIHSCSVENECFACEARKHLQANSCPEELCPLDWGDSYEGIYPCELSKNCLYDHWLRAKDTCDFDEARKIAAQIRDLPLSKNARKLYTIIE